MTCKQIQRQILIGRYRHTFAIPNYTPKGWFECDVFELTKAGLFVEYEVKISRSDFAADVKKIKTRFIWGVGNSPGHYTHEVKHDLLKNRDVRGPSRFYYVCPPLMIMHSDVPSFAGLIYVGVQGERVVEREMVKAPQLHRIKSDGEIRKHAESVMYWRYNNLFCKLHKYNEPLKEPTPA